MATDTVATESTLAPAGPDPTTYIWQVPVFLLGAVVFVAAWQGWVSLGTPDPMADFDRDLTALRIASEKVTPDRDELKELLVKVAPNVDTFPEHASVARFVLGSGYARLAELTPAPEEARAQWMLARQHFELVHAEQLSDSTDVQKLTFRAAKARVAVGLPPNTPAAELKYQIALLANIPFGEEAGEAGRLQADLALRLSPPDIPTAREALTRYLTATGIATPPASLARAKLTLGDLHLRRGEFELARKWLSEIGADAPPEVIAPGKALLAQVKMREGSPDWLGAARDLETLRALQQGVSPSLRAASAYYLGVCKLNTREPDAAIKVFEEAVKGDGPEASAAAIRLAELYLKGSDAAKRTAVPDLLVTVVKGYSDGKGLKNLVRADDVRNVFELAVPVLIADEAYEAALKVVDTYGTLSAPGRDREKRAEVLSAWATSLQKANGEFKPKAADAAAEFEALAALQPAVTAKADMFRHAATMYRLASDPAKAVEVLQLAVSLPQLPDATAGPVWSDLADALIAAKRPDEVWDIFNKIMALASPVSTATRYRLARQFTDTRQPDYTRLGRALFEQIAKQETISQPEQEFHERALVELAHEYIRANNFADSETWLRKQLSMYPAGPEAPLGRLLLGVCLLQRADIPSPGLDPTSVSVAAAALRREALGLFKQIVKDTEAKLNRDKKLNDRDGWLRLQAGLRVLQTYQKMQQPNDLLAEAAPLLERHHDSVEELIILSLVYHAFKQKNEMGKALQTRDKMKELFDHLKATDFPAAVGEYSRTYWEKVWFADK